MSTNRMWLEHVDTGERVLLAKFNRGQWDAHWNAVARMDADFDRAREAGHVYRDGIPQSTENTYRIVYEHGDAP